MNSDIPEDSIGDSNTAKTQTVDHQKDRLQAILENASDGIHILDRNGNVIMCSHSFARMLGYSYDEAIRLNVADWDTSIPQDNLNPNIDRLIQNPETFESSHRRKDGSIIPVEIATSSFELGGSNCLYCSARDITERKKGELERRRQAGLIESLLESSPDVVFIKDRNGTYLGCNPAFSEFVGKSIDKIIGKTDYDLFDKETADFFRDHDCRMLALGKPRQNDEWITYPDGHKVLLNTLKTPFKSLDGEPVGVLGISRDITERKQSEEALRLAKEDAVRQQGQLQAILNHVSNSIAVFDRTGKQIYINPAHAKLFGFESIMEAMLEWSTIATNFSVQTYPDRNTLSNKDWPVSRVLAGEHLNNETYFVIRLDQGKEMVHSISGDPIYNAQGEIELAVIVTLDITQQVEQEEQDRILQERLEQTQRLESLGVLAGGIAHDFNNLLMGILGYADLILQDLSPVSPSSEDVIAIKQSALRAADLCAQLLAYAGKGQIEQKMFSVSELTEEMLQMLRTCISKKCLINLNLEHNLPPIEGDPSQLRQVIMNFVLNAAEAIGDRSGIITISTGAIECSSEYLENGYLIPPEHPGLYTTIEVSDTGCGMDSETKKRIFEPFFTTKFTGRGLGLSTVAGIIRSHGGGLRVYSEPNKGSTFKVLLPAKTKDCETNSSKNKAAYNGELQGTVLLVDDEETVRAVTSRILKKLGMKVILAEDGKEALEIYQKKQSEIDIVLLDLTMPHMGGQEAFRELIKINPEIKVVIASGYNESSLASLFGGKKISGCIQKPYSLLALQQLLTPILGQQ